MLYHVERGWGWWKFCKRGNSSQRCCTSQWANKGDKFPAHWLAHIIRWSAITVILLKLHKWGSHFQISNSLFTKRPPTAWTEAKSSELKFRVPLLWPAGCVGDSRAGGLAEDNNDLKTLNCQSDPEPDCGAATRRDARRNPTFHSDRCFRLGLPSLFTNKTW